MTDILGYIGRGKKFTHIETESVKSVSGGNSDLIINGDLKSVVIQSAEATVDAIKLNASATAGGVDMDAGTGGVTIDSGTGAISIGSDADTGAITVGIGAAARTITIGNVTTTTTLALRNGPTGACTKIQVAPQVESVDATLTAAEVLKGIINAQHSAGATQTFTLPTATELVAVIPGLANDDSIDLYVINRSLAVADTVTIAAGVDGSEVGVMIVDSVHTTAKYQSSGHFRIRFDDVSTESYIIYRIA